MDKNKDDESSVEFVRKKIDELQKVIGEGRAEEGLQNNEMIRYTFHFILCFLIAILLTVKSRLHRSRKYYKCVRDWLISKNSRTRDRAERVKINALMSELQSSFLRTDPCKASNDAGISFATAINIMSSMQEASRKRWNAFATSEEAEGRLMNFLALLSLVVSFRHEPQKRAIVMSIGEALMKQLTYDEMQLSLLDKLRELIELIYVVKAINLYYKVLKDHFHE